MAVVARPPLCILISVPGSWAPLQGRGTRFELHSHGTGPGIVLASCSAPYARKTTTGAAMRCSVCVGGGGGAWIHLEPLAAVHGSTLPERARARQQHGTRHASVPPRSDPTRHNGSASQRMRRLQWGTWRGTSGDGITAGRLTVGWHTVYRYERMIGSCHPIFRATHPRPSLATPIHTRALLPPQRGSNSPIHNQRGPPSVNDPPVQTAMPL